MGCGLNKLEKRDEKRPGNIYSTLKRPQVETKIDVAYEYRFLEFTTLTDVELPRSSAVRLSSLRDLPTQLQELYQQGFTLVTLHPFVQPTDEREKTPQEQIFRAVLIKKTERSQKNDFHNEGYILELDCCSSLDHLTDQKIIPNFIKKIQDAASRGLEFVGVVPQYHCPGNSAGSSPLTPTANGSGESRDGKTTSDHSEDLSSLDRETPGSADMCGASEGSQGNAEPQENGRGDGQVAEPQNLSPKGGNGADSPEKADGPTITAEKRESSDQLAGKMEIFTIFNKPKSQQQRCRQYYTVTIPLRVSKNGRTVNSLDANWLEHMSDHFRKGGVLVNAIFYLGMVNDSLHGLTDGVFIFEDVSTEENKTIQAYDAIVVEQWTVLEGVEVQTDYIPLLNSLAAYGWQLTCVLPTPVVKTNREGNLATKQIVFLQRPSLPQKAKKKESKFQWRFSREDMHSRQMRKSKSKLSARGKQKMEENEKNQEDQHSKAGDVGNCLLALNQADGVTSGEGEGAPEELDGALQEAKGEEEVNPSSEVNGTADCRVPCQAVVTCNGEDNREAGFTEAAGAEPPVSEEI
ncbi:raftlin isoform X2 [Dromiciops gliroides]|uniref:raftlin isoform X2 n=1 Tax=Dromiciops gliroides TaxID=33562 RepID=UPI001CC53799|nr:raftlin isoform X2 [Dromiciops gliroides]